MNILITGGNGKLGQNIVDRLNTGKNKIFLITRNLKKSKNIFKDDNNIILYNCNLEKYEEIRKTIILIEDENDKVDIVINNAAVDIDQPMIETKKEDFEKIMSINLFAPYYICQNTIPYMMKEKFGKIINGMKGYTTKVNETTGIFSKNDDDYDDWKQSKERIPLSRRGKFEEFVNVIEFLCSDNSNYITGTNIPVDGGIIAKL